MNFAKWMFRLAGSYGIVILFPFYFVESNPQAIPPPAITHPEYYYGFVGVSLAFQVVFLIISTDPIKYRLLMIPAILEKFPFAIAVALLLAAGRVGIYILPGATIDAILGTLFVIAFWKTRTPKA
ncbi:MAG TPA: hypothetical protein VHE12_04315 [bacterium]|nr:hypothetical protein [bacterium]